MNEMDDYRLLNGEEILLGCKIILETQRTVSVGKFIKTYARLENDTDLMRKVHAKLLEDKKYTASHEIDKYGFPIIKYSNKSYGERNPIAGEVMKFIIIALITLLIDRVVRLL